MKITKRGTFIYAQGVISVAGWEMECDGDEEPTENEIAQAVLEWLMASLGGQEADSSEIAAKYAIKKARDA